jgi:uroporphyrinogen-III decarboxylase
MQGKDRLKAAFDGLPTDATAVMPKMWLDVAARIMDITALDVLNSPQQATCTLVRAARRIGADGVRLLLFPQRSIINRDGRLWHVAADGAVIGEIDYQGGWSTRCNAAGSFDLGSTEQMAHYHCWHGHTAPVRDSSDVAKIAVPMAEDYEKSGYGAIVEAALQEAGDAVGCVGDCNSGTLAFQVAMRGMDQALLDLYDDPALSHAIMEKGIAMSVERARFFVSHGVRLLRYNDSVANMTVISPDTWRTFILPRLHAFCQTAHNLAPGVRVYCHICGDILPIAADLAESGLDCIAPLDPLGGHSVAEIRSVVGPDIALMGGVNTLSFINSSVDEITAEAACCIQQGSRGGPFILGSGCVLPRQTRLENLQAVIETAHAMAPQ